MQLHNALVPVTYREPFAFGKRPWHDVRPQGETVFEIVRSVPNLPRFFLSKGVVCINGEPVPRELWSYVRPKPASETLPIAVTLHWPLQDGGGGRATTKSIVGLVAALALVVITAGIGAGFVPGLAAGSFGAIALAGAVGVGGALAISALTRPPTTQDIGNQAAIGTDVNSNNKDAAGATGNVLVPGGSIPRVIGTRKVFPPLISFPEVEQINTNDEQVTAVFALNGPHDLGEIQIDGVSITAATDISYETKIGDLTDTALTSVTRQGKMLTPQITLTQHTLGSDDVTLAQDEFLVTDLTAEIPQWHRFVTFDSPDEVFIQLLLPGGLGLGAVVSPNVAMPFRMRMREMGASTWINFPEFHLGGNALRQTRRQIRLRWGVTDVGSQPIPTTNGWVYLRNNPPTQSITPASPSAWIADSHFDTGGGNDYAYAGTELGTRIINYNVSANYNLDFLMTSLPQGRYEIEIKRGCVYDPNLFNKNTYAYSGTVQDFFWAKGTDPYTIPQNQSNIVSQCTLVRCVSIWNEHPVADGQGKFCLIAIKALNRNIQRASVIAAGRVGTWNGSNWSTIANTGNPAAHYRSVLLGAQNHDPLDATLVDDAGLASWYAENASHDWRCDAIIDDMRTQDVLDLLASCGYARPYQSDQYGVIVDDDRSLNSPIQVFSRINTSNMKFEKAFARVPAGIIINYRDINSDYEQAQEIVLQTDPLVGTTGLYETISYDGLVDAAHVAARGKFDLDQANLRSTFYSFDCDIESIVCRRGDLVAIQHDILADRAGDAHIKTILTSGANITGLVLDSEIPVLTASVGVAIRHTDGTITTHQIVSVLMNTATITFTTPFANPGTIVGYDTTNDEYGCLIVSGDLTTVYKRMLVHTITATKDLKASITLVDEAPTLVRY